MISNILKNKIKVLYFYLKLKSQSKNLFRNVKFENGYYGIPSDNRIKKWSPKFSTSISNCKVNQKMSSEMWSLKMVIMVFQIKHKKCQSN